MRSVIKNVAKRIIRTKQQGNQVVAIASAMGDSTDDLIALAKQIAAKPSKREMDMLGNRWASLHITSCNGDWVDGWKCNLVDRSAGGNSDKWNLQQSKNSKIVSTRLEEEIKSKNIVIVAGFQGMNGNNDITTLEEAAPIQQRYTAAAVRADVWNLYGCRGVYAADPRIVKMRKKIGCYFIQWNVGTCDIGCGSFINPRSVEVAKTHGVKIHVRSSFSDREGTIVQEEGRMEKDVIVMCCTRYGCGKNGNFRSSGQAGCSISFIWQVGKKQH